MDDLAGARLRTATEQWFLARGTPPVIAGYRAPLVFGGQVGSAILTAAAKLALLGTPDLTEVVS